MEQDKQYDAIIIGAGVAGLTAALHLAERGLKPLLFEAGNRVGGRLSGKDQIDIRGWSLPLEHGVHGIWSSYVNLKSMLKRHEIVTGFIPAYDEQWIHRAGNFIGRTFECADAFGNVRSDLARGQIRGVCIIGIWRRRRQVPAKSAGYPGIGGNAGASILRQLPTIVVGVHEPSELHLLQIIKAINSFRLGFGFA